MPIPKTRPVVGRDLDALRERLGLTTADACWLFGLSMNTWAATAKTDPDAPVANPTLALLVRFLDEHPEVVVIPKMPNPQEMADLLNEVTPTPQRAMSVLFGNEGTAAYRWLKVGVKAPPTVQRLMFGIKQALLRRPAIEEKLQLLNSWRETVDTEAKARGEGDIFATARWPAKQTSED